MDKNLSSVSDAYKHLVSVYEAKNSDYGNSFEECCNKFGLVSAVVMMNDKLNKINSLYDKSSMKVDESLADTLLDLANYAVMTVVWMNNRNCAQPTSSVETSPECTRNSDKKTSDCHRDGSGLIFSDADISSLLSRGYYDEYVGQAMKLFASDLNVPLEDFKKASRILRLNLKVDDIDDALIKAGIIDKDGDVTRHAIYENYAFCNDGTFITARGISRIVFDEDIVDQIKQFKIFR